MPFGEGVDEDTLSHAQEIVDKDVEMGLEERLREQSLLVCLVEEIFEGGREAFETRRRRHGF
ncbi:MAG: hypothetical protein OXH73_14065 [Caldilineaceae bacterium]|nr:hypothetical protein [Caldilineaceae bacterium]